MKRSELMQFALWLYRVDGVQEYPVCINIIDRYKVEKKIDFDPEDNINYATGGIIEGKTVMEPNRGEKVVPVMPHAWRIE